MRPRNIQTHKSPSIGRRSRKSKQSQPKPSEEGLSMAVFCPTIRVGRYCKCHKMPIKYYLRKRVIWHIFIMSKLRLRKGKTAKKSINLAAFYKKSVLIDVTGLADNGARSCGSTTTTPKVTFTFTLVNKPGHRPQATSATHCPSPVCAPNEL